jgi:hypothetical protein
MPSRHCKAHVGVLASGRKWPEASFLLFFAIFPRLPLEKSIEKQYIK